MNNVYGVSFKNDGKVYYFLGNNFNPEINEKVIVETEKGYQYGKVMVVKKINELNFPTDNMKSIVRIASEEDENIYMKNIKLGLDAVKKCKEIVAELGLDMNVIDANFTFDKKQLLINFLADDRVDFRELAKRLAAQYKTRIELRQIGARDKAKEISGIGICGRKLCCSSCLNHMDSISMNMAKNQNIALNPSKINGACGRLLCCLSYENDEYVKCQNGMPYVNQTVTTDFGKGKVVSVDILNRKYKVNIDNDIKEIELNVCEKCKK